jgi:acyl-CoA synthetase (AMP-forming)/AMP-acid ligase II
VPKESGKFTKKDIQNFCRFRLGDNNVPKYVEFALSLPKYQSGKVNKEVLRSQARKSYSEKK